MTRIPFYFLIFCFFWISAQSRSIFPRPIPLPILEINTTQNAKSCSYTVVIRTSCSSPRSTQDKIGLSFSDAYGNQVYVPRLDNPRSRAFERCSTDTFQIYGPCTYQICSLYLYRSGSIGWMPYDVKVYGQNSKDVTFYFNVKMPRDTWFGFNNCRHCTRGAASSAMEYR